MSGSYKSLDPVDLSALLASRLCHDLINPVGALGSGLEVFDDADMDEAMRDAALDLIRSGGTKSVALLKYARLAYGAGGGFGARIAMEEAETVLREIYKWVKPELEWRVPAGLAPKDEVKTVLILAYAAADCTPRGGVVRVEATGEDYVIEATGPRLILQEDLSRALAGDTEELKPKFAPAYIAGLLARQAGGETAVWQEEEKIMLRARFAASGAIAASR